jgi:hypothetical protein
MALTVGSARSALTKTAEKGLELGSEKVVEATTRLVGRAAATLVGSFATEFAKAFLSALLDKDGAIKAIRSDVSKLVRAPLLAGIEQLRVAALLPTVTPDEAEFMITRHRQALNHLDQALSLCEPEERPLVAFLRGVAALNIPGGLAEARMHFVEFRDACATLGTQRLGDAAAADAKAQEAEVRARQIAVQPGSRTRGAGRGLVGFSAERLERANLEAEARRFRRQAEGFRGMAAECQETADRITHLL